MFDILWDNLNPTAFYLFNSKLKDNQLITSLGFIQTHLGKFEIDLYDEEKRKRIRVRVPRLFVRLPKHGVYDLTNYPMEVVETYLL